MKLGNWVPISKAFIRELPKNGKKYDRIHAAFCLSIDYDNDEPVTVAGYASLWGWSRDKVRNFLNQMGVEISYPEDTKKNQNQKGIITLPNRQITIQKSDRKPTDNRQMKLIDSKWLHDPTDRSSTDNRQITDRSLATTIDPEPKPEENSPEPPADSGPEIISISLRPIDGEEQQHLLYELDVKTLADTFPGVDILAELKKIKLWNIDNPKKRKTSKGIGRHISSWLEKAQEKIPGGNGNAPALVEQKTLEDLIT